jgi:allantoate deiminase
VVTGIAGGTRLKVTVEGVAGHAGTVPMGRRHDALTAAAEMILAIEHHARAHGSMVATVGRIAAAPGAINFIPGEATFTLDLRALSDDDRRAGVDAVVETLTDIAERREVALQVERLYDSNGAASADWLMDRLGDAIAAEGHPVHRLVSGAGHDAMAMAELTDIAMLFVRCKGGISHNPAESITAEDAGIAARVLLRFLADIAPPPRD